MVTNEEMQAEHVDNAGKSVKVKTGDKVMELKEDRSLFASIMLACKTRPEIDFEDGIGSHECSVGPRSLFSSHGTMPHYSQKSALMEILEKLPPFASTPLTLTRVPQTIAGSVNEEIMSTGDSGYQQKRVLKS